MFPFYRSTHSTLTTTTPHHNHQVKQTPMNDEAMLLNQFSMLKRSAPGNKVWLYRGTIYAYPWYKETRLILDDPAYDPWFLKFVRSL